MPSSPPLRILLLAPLLLLGAGGCGPGDDAPEELPDPPNIVLFTIDTLRADHLHCYGYRRETSPVLDALAAEGILFERAYSVMGTTLPAHLSIMTGLYPHQHGFVANHGAMSGAFQPGEGRRAVAELLSEAGYNTAAFVSGPTVARGTGLDAGFEVFEDHVVKDPQTLEETSRRSGDTTTLVLEWLGEKPREPFFLWVHYWDPHEPNIPLEPFASAFESDEELDLLIDERRIRPEVLEQSFSPDELARLFAPELAPKLRRQEEVEMPPIDREAVRRLLNLYDGDVLATDHALGRVLRGLRKAGFYEQSIITFLADHGQALGQHDWLEHGRIQTENLHVPLVIRFPEGMIAQPSRFTDAVSLVDVLPTILARLRTPAAEAFLEQASGEDLLSGNYIRNFAFAQRSERERDWEPGEGKDGSKLALTTPRWKYYLRPDPDAEDELYDLEADPGELVDVIAEHPEVVSDLRRHAGRIFSERTYVPEAGSDLDSERARRLREALKYLGYTDSNSSEGD